MQLSARERISPAHAIFGVFFLESVVLGNWIPRIPEFKSALALSDSELGLCLLAMPAGTFLGLMVAGRLTERLGLRQSCRVTLPLWALAFVLPAFATSGMALGATLALAGFFIGLVEVAMNTKADVIEKTSGRRLMSRCHGFWSLGSMAGALLGSTLSHFGVSVQAHFLVVMPLVGLIGWWTASRLPPDAPVDRAAQAPSEDPLFRLPSRGILLLCAMPLGIMVVEGSFIDWSAVFMRSVLDASPLVIGTAYAFFSVVMAATRLCGDSIADRFGDLAVVRCSGLAAAGGVALFALAPTVPVAYLGAALSGAGVAIVYPLAISAAARRPGRSAADNVAAMTMISFCAFLLAPPLIGFVSDAIDLRWALGLLAPIAFTTFLLAGEVTRERSAA